MKPRSLILLFVLGIALLTPAPAQVKRSGKTFMTVYFEEEFKGKSVRIEIPCELANAADLKAIGVPNDSIQSLKIPDGYTVTLWDAANYGGATETVTGKVPKLGITRRSASSLKVTAP